MTVELEKSFLGIKYRTDLPASIPSLLKVKLSDDDQTEFFTYTKVIQPRYLLVKPVEVKYEEAKNWRPIDLNPNDPNVRVYEGEEINEANLYHRGLLITERYRYRRP